MEFREYYQGVCARIRYDYHTRTYVGELDGLPTVAFIQAESYEGVQASLKAAVDEHLATASIAATAEDEWDRVVALHQAREARENEEAKRDAKLDTDPYERRRFLR
jgi:predicted RNase H-like HicB family nuclease